MLSKTFRLKRGDIKLLQKKCKKDETDLFIVKIAEGKGQNMRFSVLVSRKIFPKAVQRNHLRRQIYEAIRLNMGSNTNDQKDIILIPKKHITELSYQEIEKGIMEMLKSINKWSKIS